MKTYFCQVHCFLQKESYKERFNKDKSPTCATFVVQMSHKRIDRYIPNDAYDVSRKAYIHKNYILLAHVYIHLKHYAEEI